VATGLSRKLTGQIGEYLVAAELGRRGIIATPFAGNVPDIDIVAYANNMTIPIQVKAKRKKGYAWQFSATKFLEIEIEDDFQKIIGRNTSLDRDLLCVFLRLGDSLGEEAFFILPQGWLQDFFMRNYKGGHRTKNPKSYHCAIWEKHMQEHIDRWDLIKSALGF